MKKGANLTIPTALSFGLAARRLISRAVGRGRYAVRRRRRRTVEGVQTVVESVYKASVVVPQVRRRVEWKYESVNYPQA